MLMGLASAPISCCTWEELPGQGTPLCALVRLQLVAMRLCQRDAQQHANRRAG